MASSSATRQLPTLSLEAAQIAAEGAQGKAKQMGIDFNIALVDSTLHLLHFTRMPNAKLTSIQIAIDKAFTAAGHRAPTSMYQGKNFLPGGPAYGIHNSNGGRFMLIGGGIPITVDGVVVGAIGVSTGTPAQDIECATAGVEAVERFAQRKQGPKL
ncbi:hypothetical protein LTR36_000714 [Oleoguttula mirabilis]|uniref:DUF336-domain-containing protein n=1 Tax=Oleoguttula mirabilis TaxID=1507867 RepID=A0AAV9JQ91_9PEZI|nr:hypothetical protein LTR36_000714 [Oleoguttula mirabilis]